MIYLELFIGFLKVGLFSFGGAYAAIPLIRDIVVSYNWINDEMLSYMIAVSESTPGPVMINTATYIGAQKGGILGSIIATFAVALPAFIIILLIMIVFKKLLTNNVFNFTLSSVKSCVIGIIFSTGLFMTFENIFTDIGNIVFDFRALIIGAVLCSVYFIPRVFKKKISSLALIGISAVLGAVIYAI